MNMYMLKESDLILTSLKCIYSGTNFMKLQICAKLEALFDLQCQ